MNDNDALYHRGIYNNKGGGMGLLCLQNISIRCTCPLAIFHIKTSDMKCRLCLPKVMNRRHTMRMRKGNTLLSRSSIVGTSVIRVLS